MNVKDKTTLPQSYNKVNLVGTLKENNLTLGIDKNGDDIIKGDMVIQTGEIEEHKVKCYAKKTTSKGNENPSYKSLAMAVDYPCIAKLTQQGLDTSEAVRVSIRGAETRLNTYVNGKGNVVAFPEIFVSFIKHADEKEEAGATFEVDGVLGSILPEFEKDEETGRFVINLILFDYKGCALPIEFIGTKEVGAYMSTHYEVNRTSRVWGKLVSTVYLTTKVTEGILGDKTESFENYRREMLITDGTPTQKEVVDGYDIELVKKAMAERQILLDELKKNGNKPSKAGFASPSTATSGTANTVQAPKW